jgi:hypothetical protein
VLATSTDHRHTLLPLKGPLEKNGEEDHHPGNINTIAQWLYKTQLKTLLKEHEYNTIFAKTT